MSQPDPAEQAKEFLNHAALFRLGHLPTETPHPRTTTLSRLVHTQLPVAVETLKSIDIEALQQVIAKKSDIKKLWLAIQSTLTSGRRVFFCGCGATGRLSLINEFFWRTTNPGNDQVIAFMAGGDVALVHAIEGFEDFPALGARQLEQLGFQDGDLLVSSTEGGETPFVIGATKRAAEISKNHPFFLFCNPSSVLCESIVRSREVINSNKINSLDLSVGPMGLTGSTRMQASTVLQLVTALCLIHWQDFNKVEAEIQNLLQTYKDLSMDSLPGFITEEASIYQNNGFINYCVRDFGITVFTDTTERAPTFSLVPFQPVDGTVPSLCHILLPEGASGKEAWQMLLSRSPRPLNWDDVGYKTSTAYMMNFDFSPQVRPVREKLAGKKPFDFEISRRSENILWNLNNQSHQWELQKLSLVNQHLILKMILNIHSTLVMGKLGRYHGNLMTWVYPSNGKLVDRAARYLTILIGEKGQSVPSYEDLVHEIFKYKAELKPGESVIHRVLAARNLSDRY